MRSSNEPVTRDIFLLLFDISGYTRFLCDHGSNFAHAEQIVSALLESIIASMKPPCSVYEITGDAVSFYLESGPDTFAARRIWEQVDTVFTEFRSAEERLRRDSAEDCPVCASGSPLQLKAVLHHCPVVFTDLHGFRKIAGPDVILAHRLLKNCVQSKEYVIVTADFYFAGGMMTPMGAVLQGEQCDGFGEVGILVWYPPGRMPDELRPAGRRQVPLGWNPVLKNQPA